MPLHPVLEERLNAALEPSLPVEITRRAAGLPGIPEKTHAVIGMRRATRTASRASTKLRRLRLVSRCSGAVTRLAIVNLEYSRPQPLGRFVGSSVGRGYLLVIFRCTRHP